MPRSFRHPSFRHPSLLVLGICILVLPLGCGRNPAATSSSASASVSRPVIYAVSALVFSPDGKKLATAAGPKVTLWESDSGKELAVLENSSPDLITHLAFSPDGKMIAGAAGKSISMWSVGSGKVEKTLSGHLVPVSGVGFSADGKILISSASQYNRSNSIAEVWLWDIDSGQKTAEIKPVQETITCLAMNPDHKLAATGGLDASVRVRDLTQKSDVGNFRPGGSITCLVFSSDGKTLAVASTQGIISLWDAGDWKEKGKIEGAEDLIIGSLDYSPDGKFLAGACNDQTIRIWEAATGKLANTLEGHSQTVTAVAYSKDSLLASGSQDGNIRFWDPASGKSRQMVK